MILLVVAVRALKRNLCTSGSAMIEAINSHAKYENPIFSDKEIDAFMNYFKVTTYESLKLILMLLQNSKCQILPPVVLEPEISHDVP
jgi:hypothetical protein